jgi:hypothetical protein
MRCKVLSPPFWMRGTSSEYSVLVGIGNARSAGLLPVVPVPGPGIRGPELTLLGTTNDQRCMNEWHDISKTVDGTTTHDDTKKIIVTSILGQDRPHKRKVELWIKLLILINVGPVILHSSTPAILLYPEDARVLPGTQDQARIRAIFLGLHWHKTQ